MPSNRGRVPLQVPSLDYFTVGVDGNPPIVPEDRELTVDASTGAVGVMVDTPTGHEFKSLSKDNKEILDGLDYSGVFVNAQAGALGKDLTYFLYDTVTKTIKLNPALRFPESFRYYAIRRGVEYITGRVDGNGNVVTNIADMNLVPADYGTGNVSQPVPIAILPGVVMTESVYVVEFFDSARTLVSRDAYHAEAVKVMDHDMTSDVAVVGLKVITTRPVANEPDSCYLFVDENVEQLDYRVMLQYYGDTFRDVTFEERTNGRLQISGLVDLDTSVITPDGSTPPHFTVTYFLLDSNGTVGQTSISKDISVYIKNDPLGEVVKFLPIYWVTSSTLGDIERAFLALYSNGKVGNIDSKLTDITNIPVDASGQPITDSMTPMTANFILGTSSNVPVEYTFGLKFTGTDLIKADISMDATVFDGGQYASMTYTIGNDGSHKGLLTGLNAAAPEQTMINDNKLIIDTDVYEPTHFRIRNIEGTHYYTGGVGVAISQVTADFDIFEGAYPIHFDTPIIIEYIKVSTDGNGNPIIDRVTNARAMYVNIVNNG